MTDEERKARERHPAGKELFLGVVQSRLGERENYTLTDEEFKAYVLTCFHGLMLKVTSAEKHSIYIRLLQQELKAAANG